MTTNHPPILTDEPGAQDHPQAVPAHVRDSIPAPVEEGVEEVREVLGDGDAGQKEQRGGEADNEGKQLTIFDAEDPGELLDQIDAPPEPQEPKYPDHARQQEHANLLRGGTSRRNRKTKPVSGHPQTEQELRYDQESGWNSTKILASLIRWAIDNTSKDRRSYELVVLLYLIRHIGWDPNEPDYLTCENITHERVAKAAGCTTRSVSRALAAMKTRGLLSWRYVHWSGRGQRKCCRYTLLGTGAVMDGDTLPITEDELVKLATRVIGGWARTIKRCIARSDALPEGLGVIFLGPDPSFQTLSPESLQDRLIGRLLGLFTTLLPKSLQDRLIGKTEKPTGQINRENQKSLQDRLIGKVVRATIVFLLSTKEYYQLKNSYQPKNARKSVPESTKTKKPKSVKSEAVRKANRARRDSSNHPTTLDELPIELRSYAQACIEIFEGAHANSHTPRPIDWQGLDKTTRYDESFAFRVMLRDPKKLYARLARAQAECPGKPLFTGVIFNAVTEVREELDDAENPEYTPEERAANKQRFDKIVSDAFGTGSKDAPAQTASPPKISSEQIEARAERKGITLDKARRELEAEARRRVLSR